ncbi:MAG: S41 family peptidase [Treponema sp.]|nr:S41 family peptidase [Treponema sp.]
MNNVSKNSNRIVHTVVSAVFFLGVSIVSSQCFAQSSVGNQSVSNFQYMKKISAVFDYVQQNYVDEVDAKVLYEGALKGMLEALKDPYTLYLDPNTMRDLSDTTAGNFGGVGLSISKPMESSPDKPAYVEVASPIEDTPGAKAGIQSGDYITAIDGLPTPDMTMEEVLNHLRGEVGTPVTVSILRGKDITFDAELVRAVIEVPTVKYGMINQTGYLRIIEFTPETPHRVQEALDSFAKNGYKNLIIDLRDNPGGLITSVADVADKFIDSGTIVATKSRLKFENNVYMASKDKTTVPSGTPIIVLINHGSASASEILSGALKDDHLAYLVGQRSYGKGSVQQVIPLSDTDGFKMTMARYYTPSDTNIDKVGIPPDKEVLYPELTAEEEKAYVALVKSNDITSYVDAHPSMTENDIAAFAVELHKKYTLDESLLRRLIRLETTRTTGTPLYDLDYDIQLNAALDILKTSDFQQLVKSTKTLKELQDEAAAKDAEKPAVSISK